MIDINLLPWRERKFTLKIKKHIIFCGLVVVLALALWWGKGLVFSYYNKVELPSLDERPRHILSRENIFLRKIKYIGYIRQQNTIWGIVTLPNGSTQDVQAGRSLTTQNLKVVSVDEENIVLQGASSQRYVLHRSVRQSYL